MNILDIIKHEHHEASQLFKAIEKVGNDKARREMFINLYNELESHIIIEEEVFYSKLKDSNSKIDVLEAVEEHNVARHLLEELTRPTLDSDTWLSKFIVLKESIEHHVLEEERDLFPLARDKFDLHQLKRMGELFSRGKQDLLKKLKIAS